MKCLVCEKNYEAAECPRCKFPYIQVPATAPADFLVSLKPTIDGYRKTFLQKVLLQLPIHYWKDQNGTVVEDRTELLSLGSAAQLTEKELWLEQKFARIPEEKEIVVTVYVFLGEERWQRNISLPNLHKPELQQIGATIDNEGCLRLMLRNETEKPTISEAVSLFEP